MMHARTRRKIDELKDYQLYEGSGSVPRQTNGCYGEDLANWLQGLRVSARKGTVPREVIETLRTECGVEIDCPAQTIQTSQIDSLERFRAHVESTGNGRLGPADRSANPTLYDWAYRTHQRYDDLPSELRSELEALGFQFVPGSSPGLTGTQDRQFRQRAAEIIEFWYLQNHPYVPSRSKLGKWILYMAKRARQGKLEPACIDRLVSLGVLERTDDGEGTLGYRKTRRRKGITPVFPAELEQQGSVAGSGTIRLLDGLTRRFDPHQPVHRIESRQLVSYWDPGPDTPHSVYTCGADEARWAAERFLLFHDSAALNRIALANPPSLMMTAISENRSESAIGLWEVRVAWTNWKHDRPDIHEAEPDRPLLTELYLVIHEVVFRKSRPEKKDVADLAKGIGQATWRALADGMYEDIRHRVYVASDANDWSFRVAKVIHSQLKP